MGALAIRNIHKTYNETVHILKGIDLEIEAGEFLILVGPSGCGKSTLLSMIAGLDHPTSGSIHIGERDVTNLPSKDRDIAMVFQSYALYPNMTVAQNIAFGLEIRKVPKAERKAAVDRVSAMLQIGHLLDRKPGQLSGGQRQRVAMGRALARNPQLFLFDEPLSNLDAKLRVEMRAEIKRLHQLSGITSVYVTHDQVEAMTLGSRIAVMKGGVLQQLGTPDEIYNRPANTYVATFIGSPTMNLVEGRASGTGQFTVAGAQLALAVPDNASKPTLLGLRPEHIRLNDAAPWRGVVNLVEPTGADTYVVVDTAAGKVTVRAAPQTQVRPGDAVGLDIQAEHVTWFDQASGLRL